MDELTAAFAAGLPIDDPAVRAAFQRTPRHLFVSTVALPDGSLVAPTPEEVYRDVPLPTRRDAVTAVPTSSSTQPSLMARMLELLDLRPGLRVLEVGVGTGYNAALVAALTRAPVVSVDVQPDVVEAARAALGRAGVSLVRVEHADGYTGFPAAGPYDRIVATCGVRGVPPGWLDQLAEGGFALVPLAHGGLHPLVRVTADRRAAVVGNSGFMHAAGALYPRLPDDFAKPVLERPHATVVRPAPVTLVEHECRSLWFAAAVADRRVTTLATGDTWLLSLSAVDESLAWFVDDRLEAAGDAAAALADDAEALLERWVAAGRPDVTAWHTTLEPAPGLADPLLVATSWSTG